MCFLFLRISFTEETTTLSLCSFNIPDRFDLSYRKYKENKYIKIQSYLNFVKVTFALLYAFWYVYSFLLQRIQHIIKLKYQSQQLRASAGFNRHKLNLLHALIPFIHSAFIFSSVNTFQWFETFAITFSSISIIFSKNNFNKFINYMKTQGNSRKYIR